MASLNNTNQTVEEQSVTLCASLIASKPNVTVAFAGSKTVGGKSTGEACVIVGVEKKLPIERLSDGDLVPKTLPTGVKTDVIEVPRIRAIGTCTSGTTSACSPHGDRYRPLVGGISAAEENGTACTLGLVVRDSTDQRLVALSTNHCLGTLYDPNYKRPTNGNTNTYGVRVMQPSPSDGGTEDDIYGLVKRATAIQFGTGDGQANKVDGGVSTIDINDAYSSILEVSNGPFEFIDKADLLIGENITKSGRTTGITPAPVTMVLSKSALVNVSYGSGGDKDIATFVDQILVASNTRFTQSGDSGSAALVYRNGQYQVAGMLFAANTAGTLATVNPIEDIAALLDIGYWDGHLTTPQIESNIVYFRGERYDRLQNTRNPVTHAGLPISSSSSSSSSLSLSNSFSSSCSSCSCSSCSCSCSCSSSSCSQSFSFSSSSSCSTSFSFSSSSSCSCSLSSCSSSSTSFSYSSSSSQSTSFSYSSSSSQSKSSSSTSFSSSSTSFSQSSCSSSSCSCSCSSSSSPNPSVELFYDDMIAYWRMDEKTGDREDSKGTGTLSENTTPSSSSSSRSSSSTSFSLSSSSSCSCSCSSSSQSLSSSSSCSSSQSFSSQSYSYSSASCSSQSHSSSSCSSSSSLNLDNVLYYDDLSAYWEMNEISGMRSDVKGENDLTES